MRTRSGKSIDSSTPTVWRCGGPGASRTCDDDHESLTRLSSGHGPETAPPSVHEVLRTGGSPLPAPVRRDMEARLGHSFADVRIHTDQRAGESARAVSAHAFTVGQHVVFGRGEFDPTGERGQQTLAHELVHTIQQRGSTSAAPDASLRVSTPQDPAEHEAQAVATSSRPATSVTDGGAPAGVSRLPFGISLPSGARFLTTGERATASGVYGASIDFTSVIITDATGGGGRPFTTVLPLGLIAMNMGSAAPPPVSTGLLIHELAHVWQSQHHANSTAFMGNSLASQAGAAAAGGSAYCYVTGKWFGEYAAEQVAQQAERGVGTIRSHMRAVSPGSTDPANVVGLTIPRWETRGAPGVSC